MLLRKQKTVNALSQAFRQWRDKAHKAHTQFPAIKSFFINLGIFVANSILPYMNKLITEKLASNLVITILSLVVIFHVLILMNFIPYNIVWGGRIKDKSQLLRFEIISIAVNLLMLVVVLMKAKVFNVDINQKLITISLWVMAAVFMLNTIANLLSINDFERFVFTPLTMILSVFCLKLVLSRKPKESRTL